MDTAAVESALNEQGCGCPPRRSPSSIAPPTPTRSSAYSRSCVSKGSSPADRRDRRRATARLGHRLDRRRHDRRGTIEGEEEQDALLRQRLEATGGGPEPRAGRGLLAARFAPARSAPGWIGELQRALASNAGPGAAWRGPAAEARRGRPAGDCAGGLRRPGRRGIPAPGAGPLALPAGEGIASASANQSLTTVFLARLARELYPDSRFVRRVERLEAREGLKFEDAVLRQFSGPSFSVLRPGRDGAIAFGARSTVRDPAEMRACWTGSRRTSRGSSKGCKGSAPPG